MSAFLPWRGLLEDDGCCPTDSRLFHVQRICSHTGSTKVQDKSNEIPAIPALLELLNIPGCLVTLDAMGTQKTLAAQIQQAQADYLLCLKANHPTLFQQVEDFFRTARESGTLPLPSAYRTEAGHHRTEIRQVWAIPLDQLPPPL